MEDDFISGGFNLDDPSMYEDSTNTEFGDYTGPWGSDFGGFTAGTSGTTDLSGTTDKNGINWGSILPAMGKIGQGLFTNQANMKSQDALMQGLQSMFTQVDPFSKYRSGFGEQLNEFMTNPSQYLQSPYAKSITDAGNQAVSRNMASRGYTGSGNEQLALQEHGQMTAQELLQKHFSDLFQLSGADTGQLAGADVLGNIAGLNAAKAYNPINTANAITGGGGGGGGPNWGKDIGAIAGTIFGGPIGGTIGAAAGDLLGGLFG